MMKYAVGALSVGWMVVSVVEMDTVNTGPARGPLALAILFLILALQLEERQ